MAKKIEESDLTEFVRADLESIGFTTYAEVCFKGGSDIRCDLFARKENSETRMGGHTILFEAKLTFNLKVIEQCYLWKQKNAAHEFYVICPTTFRKIKSRKFAREVCRLLGIGVMEVDLKSKKYIISVKSVWCPNPKVPALYEEQKSIIASNSDNNYITPFKVTVIKINEYMMNRDREFLYTLIKNIKHHYKSEMSAMKGIKTNIENNVIKGFYITKENNKIVVYKDGL